MTLTCKVKFDGNSIELMKVGDDKNFPPFASLPPVFTSTASLLHSIPFGLRVNAVQYFKASMLSLLCFDLKAFINDIEHVCSLMVAFLGSTYRIKPDAGNTACTNEIKWISLPALLVASGSLR